MRHFLVFLVPFLALTFVPSADADLPAGPGDWPGWRGADRTGVSTEKGLLSSWPKDGPTLLYKIDGLGSGYSAVSIAKGRIFTTGTESVPQAGKKKGKVGGGSKELLIALNAKDGSQLWTTTIGSTSGGYPAPRSTPSVDGDRIYVQSSDGKLLCVGTEKGNLIWQRDLRKEFGGKFGGWACAESPLIDGDNLVCTPGGAEATMLCLKKTTGEVVWKSKISSVSNTAGYSSVITAQVAGEKQYIQFISGGVVGVSAQTGELLWTYTSPANRTANCSTPLVQGDLVLAASAYSTGGGAARITQNNKMFTATEVYFWRELQNHHGGMVLVGEHLYGTGEGGLLCVHFKTGQVAWSNRSVGKGSVMAVGGLLIVRSEAGPIALVEINPAAYVEKGRFNQPDRSSQRAWAHPVVAGGRLYLRDWDKLFVYDVAGK